MTTISEHEMLRRSAVAKARFILTDAMGKCPELTPMEWLEVLIVMMQRMITHGLQDEWSVEE